MEKSKEEASKTETVLIYGKKFPKEALKHPVSGIKKVNTRFEEKVNLMPLAKNATTCVHLREDTYQIHHLKNQKNPYKPEYFNGEMTGNGRETIIGDYAIQNVKYSQRIFF